jgi:1,2-diacylglycerol 3-beta-galactosyltransferase
LEANGLTGTSRPHDSDSHKRILILTAEAGFGHRSAALAIEAAFEERYGSHCKAVIANPLREAESPAILQTMAEERYDELVRKDPTLYELSYWVSDAIAPTALIEQISSVLLYDPLEELLTRHQPDVVVCTYPLFLEPLNFVFDRMGEALPLVSVITDLVTVHTIWFNPQVDLCLVPTEEARRKALRSGVPEDRVHVTGLPVHPHFGVEERPSSQIRSQLGWQTDLSTVLIVGGKRVAGVFEVARLIDRAGIDVQLAIVCSTDTDLYDRLISERWHRQVHIYGFVDNLGTLIHASDVVISKAGGLIVSETLACGRPLILCSAISGQETGNVEYVVSGQAGDWAPTPREVLTTLVRWLVPNGTLLAQRTANARRLGCPQAVYDVVDLVWNLAGHGPKPAPRGLGLRGAARLPLKAGAQVSRVIDRLEQEFRGITDAELARIAMWCIGQIETETDLKRIIQLVEQRIGESQTGG